MYAGALLPLVALAAVDASSIISHDLEVLSLDIQKIVEVGDTGRDLERDAAEGDCKPPGPEDYFPSKCWQFPQGVKKDSAEIEAAKKAIKEPYDPFCDKKQEVDSFMATPSNIMHATYKISLKKTDNGLVPTTDLADVQDNILTQEGNAADKKFGYMFLLSTLIKDLGMQKGLYNVYNNRMLKDMGKEGKGKIIMCMESKGAYAPYVDGKVEVNMSIQKLMTGFYEMFSEALEGMELEFFLVFTRPMMDDSTAKIKDNDAKPQIFRATKGAPWTATECNSEWNAAFLEGSIMFFAGGDVFNYMGLNKAVWGCDILGGTECQSNMFSTLIDSWRQKKVLISGQSAGTMIMGKNNNMLFYGMSGDPQPADPSYSMFKDYKLPEGKTKDDMDVGSVGRKQDGNACSGMYYVKDSAGEYVKDSAGEKVTKKFESPDGMCPLQCTEPEDCSADNTKGSASLTCLHLKKNGVGGTKTKPGCELAEQCKPRADDDTACKVGKVGEFAFRIKGDGDTALVPTADNIGTSYPTMGMLPFALRPHTSADWACPAGGEENGAYPPINCLKKVFKTHTQPKAIVDMMLGTPMLTLSDNQALLVMPKEDKGFKAKYVDSEEMCYNDDYKTNTKTGKALCKAEKTYDADERVPKTPGKGFGSCVEGYAPKETTEFVYGDSGDKWFTCQPKAGKDQQNSQPGQQYSNSM